MTDPPAVVAFGGTAALADELRRLYAAVEYWSPSRWERPPRGPATGNGLSRSAEVIEALVRSLTALGRTAGSGAPPDAVPVSTGVHALADQLAVVAGELIACPRLHDVVDEAQAAVSAARASLFS